MEHPPGAAALSAELKLLCAFIGMDNDEGLPARILQETPGPDWEAFTALARHHRVYPLVYTHMRRLDSALIPAQVMREMQEGYASNVFHMLRLTGAMVQTASELSRSGVSVLVLKGPVLAEYLYGDVALRTSKDLDLLVSPGQAEAAVRVLESLGYERDGPADATLEQLKRRDHHIAYTHTSTSVQIELHWRLNPDMQREPAFPELWSRRKTRLFSDSPVHCLGPEDLFVYLASHGVRHAWFRLRWLADIDRLARLGFKTAPALAVIEQYRAGAAGSHALFLSNALFGTPLPEAVQPLLARYSPRRAYRPALQFITVMEKPDPTSLPFIRYIFQFLTPIQRLRYLAVRILPTSTDSATLPLPKYLAFLYFPLRPVLWCWRRIRNHKKSLRFE